MRSENSKIADNFYNVLESLNMKETAQSFRKEFSSKLQYILFLQ